MAKKDTNDSFLGVCPICRKKLKISNSNIVDRDNNANLYYVECKNCDSSVMLAVFPMKDGIVTTMGILTDISHEDLNLIKNSEPVTTDNVLALYDYIKSNKVNKKHETKRKN